jgi:GTPase SAR1 family protein
MLPVFARGAQVAVVVFELTRSATFDHVPEWLHHFGPSENHCPVILAGNKADLVLAGGAPAIDSSKIETFRKNHNLQYFETSALNGQSVERLFRAVAETVVNPSATGTKVEAEKTVASVNLAESKSDRCCR